MSNVDGLNSSFFLDEIDLNRWKHYIVRAVGVHEPCYDFPVLCPSYKMKIVELAQNSHVPLVTIQDPSVTSHVPCYFTHRHTPDERTR